MDFCVKKYLMSYEIEVLLLTLNIEMISVEYKKGKAYAESTDGCWFRRRWPPREYGPYLYNPKG